MELKAESRKLGPKSEAALEYKEKIAKRAQIRPLLRLVQSWDEGTAKGDELTRKRKSSTKRARKMDGGVSPRTQRLRSASTSGTSVLHEQ